MPQNSKQRRTDGENDHDTTGSDGYTDAENHRVLQDDRQRHDDCADRWKGVESRERWSEGCGYGKSDEHEAEQPEEPSLVEEWCPSRPGETLEPTNTLRHEGDGLLCGYRTELPVPPPSRKPEGTNAEHHLCGQHHRDRLEHVGDPAGGERQRWDEHQEQDRDCK